MHVGLMRPEAMRRQQSFCVQEKSANLLVDYSDASCTTHLSYLI